MNRRNRHLVVLAVAVVTATIASFGVYRAVERMPVRNVDLARQFVVVAARPMPLGTSAHRARRQGCRVAGRQSRWRAPSARLATS